MSKQGGLDMAKESKHRREDRKKPQLSIKERRAKKLEKRQQRAESSEEHNVI